MSVVSVYSMSGAQTGSVELNDAVFGIEPNMTVVHEVVKNHLANCRQGTQSALTRAEVSGGGKKPWRQKGTGHARQGSSRAPQWTHGGIVFAPKPRSYRYHVNKKVRALALRSVLSDKVRENRFVVIDALKMDAIKTADFVKFLNAVQSAADVSGKALVVTSAPDQTVYRSSRNVPGVETTPVTQLNVYDIVNAQYLVVDQAAIARIEEVYS